MLFKLIGYEAEHILGTAVSDAGDVNGDGFDDVIAAAAFADDFAWNAGHVRVHSGLDGSLLFIAHGDSAGEKFGSAVSGVGDANGDGVPDFIAGAAADVEAGYESGSARVISPLTPPPSPYCFADGTLTPCPCGNDDPAGGCVNSTGAGAVLTGTGSSSAALDNFVFTVDGIQPSTSALLFVGTRGVSLPFGDGIRCAGGRVQRFPVRQTDAAGSFSEGPGILAAAPLAPGLTGYYQAWYRDVTGPCSSGFNTSNGVALAWKP